MNPASAPSVWEMLLPFIFIFVIFYFLIIRPQSKKLKEQEQFLQQLKKGDAVVTSSGILGVIEGITDQVVTLEVAPGVKIKTLRKQIAGLQNQVLEEKKTQS